MEVPVLIAPPMAFPPELSRAPTLCLGFPSKNSKITNKCPWLGQNRKCLWRESWKGWRSNRNKFSAE